MSIMDWYNLSSPPERRVYRDERGRVGTETELLRARLEELEASTSIQQTVHVHYEHPKTADKS